MDPYSIWNSELFSLVLLPILIFLARIVDVSLGTLRIIYITKGLKNLVPIVGFFESLLWIMAIAQIMQNLTNIYTYIAFAGGFGAGSYIGMVIEQRMALGVVTVRIITKKDARDLIQHLKEERYGYTSFAAYGVSGKIRYLLTVVNRKEVPHLIQIIRKFNPHAFISVEDVRQVSGDEVFSIPQPSRTRWKWSYYHRVAK